MKWLNRISNLSLIGFSILIFFLCIELGIGKPQSPGPGLMPSLAAVLLFSLSLLTFIFDIKGSNDEEGKSSFRRQDLIKPFSLVGSLIGYAFLLNILGYLVTTFLVMFVLFSMMEPKRWRKDMVIAALVAVLSFLIFDKWLHVQLPGGIFLIRW